MKKRIYFIVAAVAVIMLAACTSPNQETQENPIKDILEEPDEVTTLTADEQLAADKDVTNDNFTRNAVFIEQFTTQKCGNCPRGKKAIDAAVAGMENNVVWVANHTGYYTDELTVDGESKIQSKFGVNYAPASMVNRYVNNIDEEAPNAIFWLTDEISSSMLKSELARKAGASLNLKVTRKGNDIVVYVYGETNKYINYVSAFVCQDSIHATQSGASGKIYHMNAIRAILSEPLGTKITRKESHKYAAEFTYTIPAKVGTFDTDLNNMFVAVAIHGQAKKNDQSSGVYNCAKIYLRDIK